MNISLPSIAKIKKRWEKKKKNLLPALLAS